MKLKVKILHSLLLPEIDNVIQYVDAWGAKRLCSLAIRRFRAGIKNFRDPHLEMRKIT